MKSDTGVSLFGSLPVCLFVICCFVPCLQRAFLCVIMPPTMKADIHPIYYTKATATCACGATYTVGSTKETIAVEICQACHPFYTGLDKVLDTTGRVDKFKKRMSAKK